MWEKAEVMLWLSDLLRAITAVLVLWGLLHVLVQLPLLPVRSVVVVGDTRQVTPEEVRRALGGGIAGSFLSVDLEEVARQLRGLPWVREVQVRRLWPDRLEVHLAGYQPVGWWGPDRLVDGEGRVFDGGGVAAGPLPLLYGPPGSEERVVRHYRIFERLSRREGLAVDGVLLTPRHAWQVRFANGLVAELGREDVEDRLRRFVAAWSRTVARMPGVKRVDLRYRNGFVVQPAPGPQEPPS